MAEQGLAVEVDFYGDGGRSRGQSMGARMLGGILASSSGLRWRHSASSLPLWLKLSLISA